ncbi:LysR family transcriptional regulator [Variovorax ureilyticus]|uniref:LysR family transcriptional regulator n=1 Tax=Variovorax ureilyticus TaxID=1836198 RepID=UPI003D66EF8F
MNSTATIRHFRHFVALAETLSFTRAADQCNLSQSAFSRSIAALESDLDVALVDRVGKRCELTTVGHAVLEHARHVVFEADELSRCVSIHAAGETGQFRLGVGATPSALLSDPLLVYVANHYPKLRFGLARGSVDEQMAELRARKLDAIVVDARSVIATPEMHIDHLADLRAGAMCRRNHPLARRGGAVEFADLLDFPIASTSWSTEMARLLVSACGSTAHPDEIIKLRCEDPPSLLHVTLHSDAIFLGALAVGRRLIEGGELVALNLDAAGVESRFALVRLAGRSVPPVYAHLHEFIKRQFALHVGTDDACPS